MRAAPIMTSDAVSAIATYTGPVLVIRPSVQGRLIEPGHRDYEAACRLCGTPQPAQVVAAVSLVSYVPDAELIDSSEATWEDCAWQ